jgi:hypothetical protein
MGSSVPGSMAELRFPRFVGCGRWRCGAGAEEAPAHKIPEGPDWLRENLLHMFLIAIFSWPVRRLLHLSNVHDRFLFAFASAAFTS